MFALLLACATSTDSADTALDTDTSGDSDTATDTGTETGDTDTGGDTDTDTAQDTGDEPPPPVAMMLYTFNFVTQTAVADVSLEVDGTTQSSDASGHATFNIPPNFDAYVQATAGEEYYPAYYAISGDEMRFDAGIGLTDRATANVLASLYGVSLDPEKGIVSVAVLGGVEPATARAGATVTLDTTYDLAITQSATSPTGFDLGSTTTGAGTGVVVFVNVPPGDVTLSVSGEGVTTCTTFASTERLQTSLPVVADATNTMTLYCR